MEDQISLLKGAAVEICHIALNTTFCLQTQNFFCGPLRYTLEDGVHGEAVLEPWRACLPCGMVRGGVTRRVLRPASPTAGFQEEFLELLFRFHATLRRLQLQEPEYVLMAAMALFSPGEHPPKPRSFCSSTSTQTPSPVNPPALSSNPAWVQLWLQALPAPTCPSRPPVLQTGLGLPRGRRSIVCKR